MLLPLKDAFGGRRDELLIERGKTTKTMHRRPHDYNYDDDDEISGGTPAATHRPRPEGDRRRRRCLRRLYNIRLLARSKETISHLRPLPSFSFFNGQLRGRQIDD